MMGDVAKGIKAFKKGMADEDPEDADPKTEAPIKTIDHKSTAAEMKQRAESESKV
jgi:sec-independent protein translocase protein TatA